MENKISGKNWWEMTEEELNELHKTLWRNPKAVEQSQEIDTKTPIDYYMISLLWLDDCLIIEDQEMEKNLVEDYCSYDVAKLLKEKGFDEVCWRVYQIDEKELLGTDGIPFVNHEVDEDLIAAPTLSLACKWLREKYNLFFSVGFGNDDKGDFLYMVDIYDLTNDSINGRYKPIIEADDYLKYNPKTYEEAVEAALKYSLENLI